MPLLRMLSFFVKRNSRLRAPNSMRRSVPGQR
jgi:hypothetical protein